MLSQKLGEDGSDVHRCKQGIELPRLTTFA